jgi:hypothetical protein
MLENIAAIGIDAEGNAAAGQLAYVEDGAMVRGIEEDSNLAGVLVGYVVEEDDVERCAANAVAVVVEIHDVDGRAV